MDRITGKSFATRSEVIAPNGMVASSQPLATQAGLEILRRGGSAVDAAIAANAVLGLVEPTGCGIGGDLFAMVWEAGTERLHGLNGSGRSPLGLTYGELLQLLDEARGAAGASTGASKSASMRAGSLTSFAIPPTGPLTVSVPGCVDGWCTLHERFGKLSLAELLAPAIDYAEQGFAFSELIAWHLGGSVPGLARRYPNVGEVWMPNGRVPAVGERFRNPMLAATYRRIAEGGREAFYEGEVARTICDFHQEQGGYLSPEDLATHNAEWVQPLHADYRGVRVWELPPNGQGLAALQMFRLLEGFNLTDAGYGSADHLHAVVEAKKLAYADRARHYADPAFCETPVEELLSDAYTGQRRSLIDPTRAGNYTAGTLSRGDTVYLATADRDGNMVSLIQSNYRGLGSGMVPPGLGFMLQNRGELFALDPAHPNVYAPGKRPFHTIMPGFATREGKPWLAFGVMGGDFQPMGHVQIISNLLDFGMNLQEAGDAPRFDHVGGPGPTAALKASVEMSGTSAQKLRSSVGKGTGANSGRVNVESGFPETALRDLMLRGHRIGRSVGAFGGYQAVGFDAEQGMYRGASESRKDGQAAGY